MLRKRAFVLGSILAVLGTMTLSGALAQDGMRMHRERHPEIVQAMRALQRARTSLNNANRDFGGHRARAQQLIDQALDQLRQAMRSDAH